MPIEYRSSSKTGSTGNGTGETTLTVSTPTGTASADLLVATLGLRTPGTVTPPADAVFVRSDTITGGKKNVILNSYVIPVGASVPAGYTWTTSTATRWSGILSAYSGVDNTNPVDVHSGAASAVLEASIVIPSVTTTAAGAVLFAAATVGIDGTFTPPSGMVERSEWSGNVDRPQCHDDEFWPNIGATGTRTIAGSATDFYAAHLIALRPAPAPPPVGFTGWGIPI